MIDSEAIKGHLKTAGKHWKKVEKVVRPYLPLIIRLLIVATFLEDGIRVMFELSPQIDFLNYEYKFPRIIAGFLIFTTTLLSLAGAVGILSQKPMLERYGSYVLIGFVFYQQILYGRHSPIGSGNLGFLMRNLCLAGSLLMLVVQQRMSEGHSALPGIPDPGDKNTIVNYIQLAARLLLVLLSLEFLTTMGPIGTLITLPVLVAVLIGYKTNIFGVVLLVLYFLHNVLNSAFWTIKTDTHRGAFDREVKRYEFVQTLSIMGGLLLLISSGPGSISMDEKLGRRKNF
mmetsp:Transcript_19091/g.33015  ORF Transcript_19091/g.33015 Transcript_19091/m.33015 type:complete len:286 (+) Transcript_19091:258-1115(+)|eukprot:CAMPEP_0184693918 /NCGR_PEP_ID=MMETSP0313-20130426/2018_1 /TAXON_ID=2792 /ORGANISM="Porphyridium aerugineum, Strain SAG 1380-2" /LENGTH=285 /DNA_ID=CAMNT_0027152095 /DNA_START=303 /DNA_END=1160 /DNA_ORIENTATION=+